MEIIADLQIHSRHSRATSKDLSIENLEKYAKIKGINLLGTGDFQHPLHREEINLKLEEDENGILWTKNKLPFLWQTEISLMFSQGGKRRAVHLLIFAPNSKTADKVTSFLGSRGRLDYDGRPIFGMSCKELVKNLKDIDDMIEIIPAHCLLPNEKVLCNSDVKPISEVEIGDKVLTHNGDYKSVTNTFNRLFDGQAYKIKPYYFTEGINITAEHPFLAIKTVKNCSYIGGLCKPNSIAKGHHACKIRHYKKYVPRWIMARDLEVNDVLLYPRSKKVTDLAVLDLLEFLEREDYRVKNGCVISIKGRQDKTIKQLIDITPEFCRLIGYYLAEGYLVKKNNVVLFAFAEHEVDYISDVVNLMWNCFGVRIAKKRQRYGSYELYFYSKIIVELFSELFYISNKSLKAPYKKLPQWMLYLPMSKQVELFKGWWGGDTGVTSSELLVQQMKFICLRLGIMPSVNRITKEQFNRYGTNILGRKIVASSDSFSLHWLSFYEDKYGLLETNLFKKFKTKLLRRHGWMDDEFFYIPIKDISPFSYKGMVYNLEVEDDNSYVTPASTVHNCMTPWFGLYGSDSGFDSLQECFEEQTDKIYAVESGMSADPSMLWRLKEKVNIVSFSDAHSFWPFRLGREATIFDIKELSYENIVKAIRTGIGLKSTIETFPEYGKYHYDGHRNCKFSCSPNETKNLNEICPVCKSKLTLGVEYRIEKLAKAGIGYKTENAKPFFKLLPLQELISFSLGTGILTKKAWGVYNNLINAFGNELNILLEVKKEELFDVLKDEKLVEIILKSREGKLRVKPGFDGEYGKIEIEEQSRLV